MAFHSEIRKSPKLAFVLFVVLALGVLTNIIGFAFPNWIEDEMSRSVEPERHTTHAGLWQTCLSLRPSFTSCARWLHIGGWFSAVQAMMILGLLASLAAGSLLLMFLFSSRFKQRNIVIFVLLACIGTVVFNVIGIAIFAAKYKEPLDEMLGLFYIPHPSLQWAFFLCCAGTGLFVLSSILAGLVALQLKPQLTLPVKSTERF